MAIITLNDREAKAVTGIVSLEATGVGEAIEHAKTSEELDAAIRRARVQADMMRAAETGTLDVAESEAPVVANVLREWVIYDETEERCPELDIDACRRLLGRLEADADILGVFNRLAAAAYVAYERGDDELRRILDELRPVLAAQGATECAVIA
ncbi:MAG: hypothetical protein JWN32_648 [Solirubrobacterales bacterium]|jgi:hypothetical protein|nr:hypothetical protein [Solirubrobacterales bacterium]